MDLTFANLILLLSGSLLGVILLKAANMSAVPAYFIIGLIIGPGGMHILDSDATVSAAAEIGIILLLFTVGLQIDLRGLKSMQRFVFLLGGLQVGVTTIIVAAMSQFFVGDWLVASLIGFVAMMSPTAVISQILIEENSVTSPTGRRALGILLFQDFLTIPLIIIYSSGDIASSLWPASLFLALKIAAVLAFVMSLGPRIMNPWLDWVAARGDKELFVLNMVVLIAASALASGFLELSFVLGPFLIGILFAETTHRSRAERVIEPFRHLFMGFFFITIGMLLDPEVFAEHAGLILMLAAGMWAIKIPVLLAVVRFVGSGAATAWRTALLMGGGGPFGFVLLTVAKESGMISNDLFQILVPANILALAITPLIWSQTEKIVAFLCKNDWKVDAKRDAAAADKAADLSGHVIICGFGATGQAAAGILRTQHPKFIALESDYGIVEAAGDSGDVVYGDARRRKSLEAAGIARAAAINITFSAPPAAALLAAKTARAANSSVHIIAKAETAQQAEELAAAGADQTLVESHQSGLSFAGQTLRRLGREADISAFKRARFRDDPFFRGRYPGSGDADEKRLFAFRAAGGISLQTMIAAEAEIVEWRRNGQTMDINAPDAVAAAGDDLVLMCAAERVSVLRDLLLAEDESP